MLTWVIEQIYNILNFLTYLWQKIQETWTWAFNLIVQYAIWARDTAIASAIAFANWLYSQLIGLVDYLYKQTIAQIQYVWNWFNSQLANLIAWVWQLWQDLFLRLYSEIDQAILWLEHALRAEFSWLYDLRISFYEWQNWLVSEIVQLPGEIAHLRGLIVGNIWPDLQAIRAIVFGPMLAFSQNIGGVIRDIVLENLLDWLENVLGDSLS